MTLSVTSQPDYGAGMDAGEPSPTGKRAVGWRIGIFDPAQATFVYGSICEHSGDGDCAKILLDDNQIAIINLASAKVKWALAPEPSGLIWQGLASRESGAGESTCPMMGLEGQDHTVRRVMEPQQGEAKEELHSAKSTAEELLQAWLIENSGASGTWAGKATAPAMTEPQPCNLTSEGLFNDWPHLPAGVMPEIQLVNRPADTDWLSGCGHVSVCSEGLMGRVTSAPPLPSNDSAILAGSVRVPDALYFARNTESPEMAAMALELFTNGPQRSDPGPSSLLGETAPSPTPAFAQQTVPGMPARSIQLVDAYTLAEEHRGTFDLAIPSMDDNPHGQPFQRSHKSSPPTHGPDVMARLGSAPPHAKATGIKRPLHYLCTDNLLPNSLLSGIGSSA